MVTLQGEKHSSQQDSCLSQRRRRLSERRLSDAPFERLESETAWYEDWQESIDCWFMGLPMPTQAELSSCIGALALHIGARFDAAVGRSTVATSRVTASNGAAEVGCESKKSHAHPFCQHATPHSPHISPTLFFCRWDASGCPTN
jgi:hypothetical protein